MSGINNGERFIQAAGALSPDIYKKVVPLIPSLCERVQEIRLRADRPAAFVCPDTTYYLTLGGGLTSAPINGAMQLVSRSDIADTFNNICNYSVYSRQSEIVNGFVTMRGGHRAGVCGTAVYEADKIINVRDITSINIRIAREYKGCSEEILRYIDRTGLRGILICGAPCSGKTTVLRDLARALSSEYGRRVSVIDERGELAGAYEGRLQNDVGMCDVFDCYSKPEGIIQAVRSMAPDVIVCDEIGSERDAEALEYSMNCGVVFIAAVHAANEAELIRKRNIKKILACGGFERIIFLADRNTPGKIKRIAEVGELWGA